MGAIPACENFQTPAGRSIAAHCRGWCDITDYVDWLEAATEAWRALEAAERAVMSAPASAVPGAAQRYEAIRAAYQALPGFPLSNFDNAVTRAMEVAVNARCLLAEVAASSRVPVKPAPVRPVPPPAPAPQPWNWWPFPTLSDLTPWLVVAGGLAIVFLLSGDERNRR